MIKRPLSVGPQATLDTTIIHMDYDVDQSPGHGSVACASYQEDALTALSLGRSQQAMEVFRRRARVFSDALMGRANPRIVSMLADAGADIEPGALDPASDARVLQAQAFSRHRIAKNLEKLAWSIVIGERRADRVLRLVTLDRGLDESRERGVEGSEAETQGL